MDKSFQLIRTNPRLTTNIKIVVDSNYNLYFESFDSSKELSNQQYKHYLLNREAMLEDEVPKFYAKLPKNLAFTPKSQSDTDVMYNDYIQQFDSTYYTGANEIDDQWYQEEFEYFAPLYVKKGLIPKKFVIFRVDEPAIYKLSGDDYVIGELSRENFRSEVIDKWKCISVFDLSNTTNVGKFFDRNINNNNRYPEFSFFFDTKKYNYSKWGGLEYQTGVYKVSEMFLDDKIFYENPHFNFEEFITKGFEDNGLLYPYILNMKFLFDDTPASSDELKKWSMNRYYGFYAEDFELVKRITTAQLAELKSGITIKNNVFMSGTTTINPYVLGFKSDQWIQVDTEYYVVKIQSNGSFKIISDRNLTGYDVSTFNSDTCKITIGGENKNYIQGITQIDKYLTTGGTEADMYADVYLIEILGQYHILKKDISGYYIQTDYAIQSDTAILEYWKGGRNGTYSGMTSVTNTNGSPLTYSIYRVKLSDIKDFDFDRINTHYSDFDYEKSEYYDTKEVKLYANEYRDVTIPVRKKSHDKGEDGQYKIKNIASEYSADDETFEIRNSEITPIFEKNQSICKWAYDGSISHSDYPYKLNNNLTCGGPYNRTTNTDLKIASVEDKTLDYFYRVGELYGMNNVPTEDGIHSHREFISNWTVSGDTGTNWSWQTTHVLGNAKNISGSSYLILNIPIIKNELYDIILTASNFDPGTIPSFGDPLFGIDPNSFSGRTTTDTGSIDMSFVDRARSNTFKIFVTNADVFLHTIKITQIVSKHYFNQSTNIQTKLQKRYDIEDVNTFNLEHYIDSNFDYFDFFFKNNMYYEDFGRTYIKPYLKYSIFGGGDGDLPATTLFKGIEYRLYTVEDMVLNIPTLGSDEETIRNIITQGGQKYNGYKFSVILNENYDLYDVTWNGTSYDSPVGLGTRSNSVYYGNKSLIKSNKEGIHIFLNDKYKNMVIIINKIIPINNEWGSLNNVDKFGENYGLYYGKTLDGFDILPLSGTTPNRYNPSKLTASYYMDSINNLNIKSAYENYVCYYYIDENGNYAQTEMIKFASDIVGSGFTSLPNWVSKFPLFYIETNTPNNILLKKKSYVTTPLKGPETNIYDKYLVYSGGRPLNQSYIDEPLSRKIEKYEVDQTMNSQVHGETISNTNNINRYIGYYEPIFKNISIFRPTYYWLSGDTYYSIIGNYVFEDDLKQFGTVEEIMYSKVNEYDNYLKLKNSDTERSYYPMVDEIGLSQASRFIFLSTWDRNFYIQTLNQQTFLQDYVAIPIQVLAIKAAAKITSASVAKSTSPSVPLANGVNLEGKNLSGDAKLIYTIQVQNLSAGAKNFNLLMYYTTNTSTRVDIGLISTTPSEIYPGELWTVVTPPMSRPEEITSAPILQEYTLWSVYFECVDASGGTSLNTQTYINYNIYNNIIHSSLSNPTVQLGVGGGHITNNTYWYNVDMTETVNSLINIPFNFELYIKKFGVGGAFEPFASTTVYVTHNYSQSFTNILLDRNKLGPWPWYTTSGTTVRFKTYHTYNIEGVDQTGQTVSTLDVPGYSITSQVKDFALVWNTSLNDAQIVLVPGSCSLSPTYTYSGDNFTINNLVIRNDGGNFTGSITFNLTLYKDNVQTNATTLSTLTPVNFTEPTTVTQGAVSLMPLITTTKTTETYKAKITATYTTSGGSTGSIPGEKWTNVVNGNIGATNLVWDAATPTYVGTPGTCADGVYSGDYFDISNIKIRNTGDDLGGGSSTYTVQFYQYVGGSWTQISSYTNVTSIGGINANTCKTWTYGSAIRIGPTIGVVTTSDKSYKAVITAPNISGGTSKEVPITALKSPGFSCTETATVTIAASTAYSVCDGTSVTFTATPTNGGTPTYLWKVGVTNVGTNSPTYTTTTLANGNVVTCVMTSSLGWVFPNPVTSNPITMTVIPLVPVSVSIVASANPVCAGVSVTFTATPVNGGSTPVYQWHVGTTHVGTNSTTYTYAPANYDVVTCVMTSSVASCTTNNPATSNLITMTTNPLPAAPTITPAGPVTQCGGTVSLTASATGTASYIWSPGGSTANPLVVSSTGTYSAVGISASGCQGPSSAGVAVTINAIPVVDPIYGNSYIDVGSTAQYTDATPGGTWSSGDPGIATISTSGLATGISIGDVLIYYSVTIAGCTTTVNTVVTVRMLMNVVPQYIKFNGGGTVLITYPTTVPTSVGQNYCMITITATASNAWTAELSANWGYLTPDHNCSAVTNIKVIGPGGVATFKVEVQYPYSGAFERDMYLNITSSASYNPYVSISQNPV